MVNLLVDLDERFDAGALAEALRGIEAAGYAAQDVASIEDARVLPSQLDEAFGGTWGCEAAAGGNIVARKGDAFAGFATYDPRGLRFGWLRGLGTEAGVGIFGPFGVAPEHRKSGIGPHLLVASLAALRARGYARALVPAVGEEKLVEYYSRHSGAIVAERFEKASFRAHRFRTVVLASGNGTHFQAVLEAANDGRLPLDITAMICNREDAPVCERARSGGVRAEVVAWDRAVESRAEYDARVLGAVSNEAPELVLLLGWMHLFDAAFVGAFGDRAINVHPAYLPLDQSDATVVVPDGGEVSAFRGAHAVQDVLGSGARWIGATAHALSLEADRGRVLARKPLRLPDGADLDATIGLLRPVEQKVVAGGIMRWVYER
jgi:phosphoribosylglycinamide formyltransferase-1